jgi:iron complex transport system permease protein
LAGQILKEMGLRNVADDAPSLLESLSVEHILQADPDYIFVLTMGSEEGALAYLQDYVENDPAFAGLSAVQNGRYTVLPKGLFHYKPNERWERAMPIFTRSFLRHKSRMRAASLLAALSALAAVLFILALYLGSTAVSLGDMLRALAAGDRSAAAYRILVYVRLPRALGALLSGAALAVAGVLIQAVLHNPMAAPHLVGVNAGAGLFAVLAMVLFPTAVALIPVSAFLGALLACLLIWLIASRVGAGRVTVTLVGVAVSSILTAGINTVKALFPDSIYDAHSFLLGGLARVRYAALLPAAVVIVLGLAAALLLALRADLLSLGGDAAASLGVRVVRTRFWMLSLAALLAGAAVSFAGLLGFVGLLVPHILRRFTGNRHRVLIPAAALGGGCLVLLSDTAARVAFAPYELPVGILLSLLGGPFFIFLVLTERRRTDD